jgi:hypothetical protein
MLIALLLALSLEDYYSNNEVAYNPLGGNSNGLMHWFLDWLELISTSLRRKRRRDGHFRVWFFLMAKKTTIGCIVIASLGVALIALARRPIYIYGVVFGLWQPRTRPPGVSARAHYVSWVEDGTWFDCMVDSRANVDFCKAWDSDGKPLANGNFRLECQGRAATSAELRPSSVSWSDGHCNAIYLFGKEGPRTLTLVPVTTEHPNPCTRATVTYGSASEASGSPPARPGKK